MCQLAPSLDFHAGGYLNVAARVVANSPGFRGLSGSRRYDVY
jgi:hypothetical protein